mmetsp:Transcript_1364/g.1951  ORF Transcript_1364/g.1951 Transcript_1364/m.1951 type:complete len:204 (-) Transcript_1364:316-927(-)
MNRNVNTHIRNFCDSSSFFILTILIILCCSEALTISSFTSSSSHVVHKTRLNSFSNTRSMTMYIKPDSPTTQTPPMVAKAFFSPQHSQKVKKLAPERSYPTNITENSYQVPNNQHVGPTATRALSGSVLSPSDTLPSFPTAHGLLSPETVMRMDSMTRNGMRNEAIEYFLLTYREKGPFACVPLLSDPNLLPHLTEAMRDIIQ